MPPSHAHAGRQAQRDRARRKAREDLRLAPVVEIPASAIRVVDLGPRVVLACSGPSLNRVDVRAPGVPVVAVSTAIRNPQLVKPDVWVFADRLNHNHGQTAKGLWDHPDVVKVIPEASRDKGGVNIVRVPYLSGRANERRNKADGRDFMDGKLPLLRDTHKSVTFALGWLSVAGVTEIIICGCDLRVDKLPTEKYGYDLTGRWRRETSRLNQVLASTLQSVRRFAEAAPKHGITLLSWSPGGRTDEFMEIYDASAHTGPAEAEGWEPAPL